MNKSQRIRTTVGSNDKYLQLKLEQDTEFLEILSLKIDQNQAYQYFNSDYGVIVGRVLANNGIAVPNAKISIFIPISDDDKERSDIFAIYPYTNPRDKNVDGKRYNLLPRVSKRTNDGSFKPVQPFGSFPPKEEIITNDSYLEVYEKYYKFTTVTNNSGDYMIFGVPVGIQTVHLSVDITDIGQFSMTPATMVSQLGYSPNLFTDNGSRIKPAIDLQDLPNIETQEIAVDVRPFWGDTTNYEIGITRQDFRIRATLVASVVVFGAGFTDNQEAVWGADSFFGNRDDSASAMSRNRSETYDGDINAGVKYNTGIASRRIGEFSIEIYTIPNRISKEDVASGNFSTSNDIVLVDKSEYSEIADDGQFIITLPCNRTKKAVNEAGELVPTSDDDPNGIYTEFIGMFIFEYGNELSMRNSVEDQDKPDTDRDKSRRVKIKFPQTTNDILGDTFTSERSGTVAGKTVAERKALNELWRKQTHTFGAGKIYSVARYNAVVFEAGGDTSYNDIGNNIWRNCGGLAQFVQDDFDAQFPSNAIATYAKIGTGGDETIPNVQTFGAEWLNFSVYFPQIFNYRDGSNDVTKYLTSDFGTSTDMTVTNPYQVVGFRRDTSYFLRSDINPTTFIEVPRNDLAFILQNGTTKGFKSTDAPYNGNLIGTDYKGSGSAKYFYRGFGDSDVLQFLISSGIISA